MKNCEGTFVTARQPTSEQACLGILGMQLASAASFVLSNMDMFTAATTDDEFADWLKQQAWVN